MQESYLKNIKNQLLNTGPWGLYSLKSAFKKVVHKTGEFSGNKVADAVTNSYDYKIAKTKSPEEIIIPPEKGEEILNKLRQVLEKCNTMKYLSFKWFNCIELCDKKWNRINYISSIQYSANKNIRFKTSMLRLDLCNYSDTYIAVKGRVSATGTNAANRRNRKLNFKNNAPFRSCISKINNTFVDNLEDLDIVMPMYNLYRNNYLTISRNFWNYYRAEVSVFANQCHDNDIR